MSAIVFLGPSAPAEAAAAAGFEVRPPARMGDVYAAALGRPCVIGIIDGYFEQTPAVWHKEVLFALTRGIHVVGGASMGALRAAELGAFGMAGVGRIYRDFAAGILEDDDEVAVAHGSPEDGYRLLSDAMVNIRYGLEAAHDAGIVSNDDRNRLTAAAKAVFYPRRSWQLVYAALEAEAGPAARSALESFITAGGFDQKRDDALETIRTVAALAAAAKPPEVPAFDFEWTYHWEQGIVNAAAARQRAGAEDRRLVNHVRAFDSRRRLVRESALLHHLAEREARRMGIGEDSAAALTRFRLRRGLETAAALNSWMRRNEASREECLVLARREARVERLAQERLDEIDAAIPGLLKLEGLFGEIASAADAAAAPAEIPGADNAAAAEAALARYREEFGPFEGSLEEHVRDLGLPHVRVFLDGAIARYAAKARRSVQ